MCINRKVLLAGFLATLYRPCLGATELATPKASIVLTAQENGLEPQSEFSCHGTIHGYIRLARREAGEHLLESRWIAPNHKIEAETKTTVDFRPARSTAYVWFLFPESSGIFGAPDPSYDQKQMTLNGPWHLEVKWDNASLIQSDFKVHCP
jgi:hypothetical protein